MCRVFLVYALAERENGGWPTMIEHNSQISTPAAKATLHGSDVASWPIMICMLGSFRLLLQGHRVAIRSAGKTEALLCYLGLHYGSPVARATLLSVLWPDGDPVLGRQSLNSLIHHLHKLLGSQLGGYPLIVHGDGHYQLNTDVGIGVDATVFELLAEAGDRHARCENHAAARESYARAANLYGGDLCRVPDVHAILIRERLRSRYLTLLAQIADYHYSAGDYIACMNSAWRLLDVDPCREDAHRLIMRCYVRRGERAAALRHYEICASILRAELAAEPEPDTILLLSQIRLQPERI